MAWNKKAESPAEEVFKFGFFYFPLTMGVLIAFVLFPSALMEASVQPVPVDQAIQARQLTSRLWTTNMLTGRTSPFEYNDDLSTLNRTITKKQMAYSVAIDSKEVFYNKQLYDIAKPIAPFRYRGYNEARQISVRGTLKQLKIEEYYPQKYETKP